MPELTFPLQLPKKRSFDIVGLGANAFDQLVTVPRHPRAGEKVRFSHYIRQGGGQTATALVVAARLGHLARYIGGVGDDDEGRAVVADLRAEGVDTSAVRVRPGGLTQRALILVAESGGERTIVWGRSEGMVVGPEELVRTEITCGRILHTDAQDPPSSARAAAWAHGAGMPVMTDLERVRPGLDALLPEVDLLIASADFPQRVTGAGSVPEALRALRERTRGGLILVTLGSEGVLLLEENQVRRFPAYEVEALDTTGAGDVFHGAFAVALLEGLDLHGAIDFSQAVAAMKCLQAGGRSGIATDLGAVSVFQRETPHRSMAPDP